MFLFSATFSSSDVSNSSIGAFNTGMARSRINSSALADNDVPLFQPDAVEADSNASSDQDASEHSIACPETSESTRWFPFLFLIQLSAHFVLK